MEKYLKKIDNKYILQEIVSQTKHSKIYFGYLIDKPNNKIVIKLFNGNLTILEESFNKILEKILKLNNSNIIKIVDGGKGEINSINSNSKKNSYYLIEEYQNKGELFDYISLYQKGFGEKISKLLFLQILYGLNYYSLQGLFIDCIRFDNILLDDDFKIKITDVLIENIKDKISSQSQFNNFDLATLLFSLVTGRDPKIIGKNINKKKLDKFWLSSKFIVTNEKLSKDFIDLFNKIILNNFEISSDFDLENYDFNEFSYYEKIMNHPWFEGIKIENILSNYNNCYDIVTQELNLRYYEIFKKKNYNEEIITLNKPINNYRDKTRYFCKPNTFLINNNFKGNMNSKMLNINSMNDKEYKINEHTFNINNNSFFYNNKFNYYNNVYYNSNNNKKDNNNNINNENNIDIDNNENYNIYLGSTLSQFNLEKKKKNKNINLNDSYKKKGKYNERKIDFNIGIKKNEVIKKSLNSKSFNNKIKDFNKLYMKFSINAQCVNFKKFKNNSIKIIQLFNITSPYNFMNKVLVYCEKISKVKINYNKFKIYCTTFKNQKELIIKISLMKDHMVNYYLIIQKIIGNNFIYSSFLSQISKQIKSF